jgi:hypothetical protein
MFVLFVLLPLAGRGGEGWGRRMEDDGSLEMSRGSLSLVCWCGTGGWPSSGDVKSPRWGMESFATPAKPPCNKHCGLQRCALDILDIDLAGRGGEVEDEDGDDGVLFAFRRWEVTFLSSSKATPWPIQLSAMDSGVSTSVVRFFLRVAVAYYGCVEASGFVPASSHDGGVAALWLDGGEREGSDCFFSSFSEIFYANARDLYVILDLMGSFVTFCTATVRI